MKKQKFDVVVAGHVCLDIIPSFPGTGAQDLRQIIVPGKLINVGAAAISTGGAVSNTGLPLIKLGIKTGLVGKVGDDFFGSGIRSIFGKWGADSALTTVKGEKTSYSVVLAPPGVDRVFLHDPGANDTFRASDIDYELVGQARLFHLGYPPIMRRLYSDDGAELVEIFRRVKAKGVTTSLDVSLPDPNSESGRVDWTRILAAVLPFVDIAPFSAEEAMFMLDRPRYEQIIREAAGRATVDAFTTEDFLRVGRRLLELGAKIAMVKCGHRGAIMLTAGAEAIATMGAAAPAQPAKWTDRELWEEVFRVERVVSATGSGDNTIAGFLAALVRGMGPEDALAVACCCGAQNVQVADAISGIHTWEETLAMIPNMEKRREEPGAGWAYDEANRVWRGPADSGVS